MPHTSIWIISKHLEAWLPCEGNDNALLLPNLQELQSKNSVEKEFLFPKYPCFIRWVNTSELGCPNFLS